MTPSEDAVLADTTNSMVAPFATAPAHSTSRSASVSAPETSPGFMPFTMICGLSTGRPNVARKPATSLTLMLDSPTTAIFWPVPS